jgi:hypothetical protein
MEIINFFSVKINKNTKKKGMMEVIDVNEELLYVVDESGKNVIQEIEDLLKKGADITYNDGTNDVLLIAAFHDDEKMIDYLLEKGADPSFVSTDGNNALLECMENHRNINIMKKLVKAGSTLKINVTNSRHAEQVNKINQFCGVERRANTTRTLLTKIDEMLQKNYSSLTTTFIQKECYEILDFFQAYHSHLSKEDQKIIQKYRLRKIFKMV